VTALTSLADSRVDLKDVVGMGNEAWNEGRAAHLDARSVDGTETVLVAVVVGRSVGELVMHPISNFPEQCCCYT